MALDKKIPCKGTGYCVKCKDKRDIVDGLVVEMKGKGERKACKGKCVKCGTSVFRILGKEEIKKLLG
jgi:hypothetical protein